MVHTIKLLLDKLQHSVLEEVPVSNEGEVPELGEHLDQGSLPHSRLPLYNDRYPALRTLVDVQHLDGKVQRQDVFGVVNHAQPVVLVQGDIQSPRQVRIQFIPRVQVTEKYY